jgi:scyllo-inositol 2-dehydrogenase (NADP+)
VSDLRVAIVGYGLAGSVFHAPFVDATEGMHVAAIVTGDPERREQARREFPSATLLAGAGELWPEAASYDLAVVAAANAAHAPLALAAIEAGLPVVVDKPMASSAEDAERMIAASREAGLMLTVFHNRRWDSDFLTARKLIADGALGRVTRFESRFERFRPEPRDGVWRESAAPADAGGVLWDLGPHLIDQACELFGAPLNVYAEVDTRRAGAKVDDDAFVALEHSSGVRSHLWMSAVAADLGPRMRVLGDRAAYVKHGLDVQEAALRDGGRPGEPGWGEEPESDWGRLGAGEDWTRVPTEPGAYLRFYEGVERALRSGAPPPVDAADSVAALEVLDAARAVTPQASAAAAEPPV